MLMLREEGQRIIDGEDKDSVRGRHPESGGEGEGGLADGPRDPHIHSSLRRGRERGRGGREIDANLHSANSSAAAAAQITERDLGRVVWRREGGAYRPGGECSSYGAFPVEVEPQRC